MDFEVRGVRYQRSTKLINKRDAAAYEAAFKTNVSRGEVDLPDPDAPPPKRKTVNELLDALQAECVAQGQADKKNLSVVGIMRKAFGARLADTVTKEDVAAYIARKLKTVAPKTINNHLQKLMRAYRLAELTPPKFTQLKVNNARQGFYTREEFARLCRFLPEDLVDFSRFAYITGMRKGEIQNLRWSHLQEGLIKIPGQYTKTGAPRSISVKRGELAALVKRREQERTVVNQHGVKEFCVYIFHREGKPVGTFDKSWATACRKAGLPEKLFHDFRRTGVRNLTRAGVPRVVAMAISGHKTDAIFRRYDIVDEQDLDKAMEQLEAYSENVVAISK